MDISAIGNQYPTLIPGFGQDLTPDNKADQELYNYIESLPTFNSELYKLKVIKEIRTFAQKALHEYLDIRARNNVEEMTAYLVGKHYMTLGNESWVNAIISMAYGVDEYDYNFIEALVKSLNLDMSSMNVFQIVSILQLYRRRLDFLFQDKQSKDLLVQQLLSEDFLKNLSEKTDNFFEVEQVYNLGVRLIDLIDKPKVKKFISVFKETFNHIPNDFVEENLKLAHKKTDRSALSKQATVANENYVFNFMVIHYYLSILMYYSPMVIDKVSPALACALVRIDDLDRQLKKLIYRVKSGYFVLLTDYPLEHHKHRVVETKHDPVHKIRIFYDEFVRLFDRGFQKIFVVVPSREFFNSYYFAKQAKQGMEHRVKVIDSHTFGLGLESLIDDISVYMREGHTEQDFIHYIDQKVEHLQYWTVVFSTKRLKKKYWVSSMESKTERTIPLDKISVLSLAQDFGLEFETKKRQEAVDYLKSKLQQALSSDHKYTKLIVNLDAHQLEMLEFIHGCLKKCPSLKLEIIPSSSFMRTQFGDHIGVCLL